MDAGFRKRSCFASCQSPVLGINQKCGSGNHRPPGNDQSREATVIDGVHVITASNRHLYEDAMEQSYRLRYRIYIEELNWRGLTRRDDGREIDQFDTSDAVHLLYLEKDRVLGGTRLFPTTEPHLLSEVFAHFASI